MSSNNDNQGKTDWSLAEKVWTSQESPKNVKDQVARSLNQTELVPSKVTILPATPNIKSPESSDDVGIVAKWKERKLSKKATLKALEAYYDSQLEQLTYGLMKAVHVEKAKIDVIAKEYLQELDARQLEMFAQLGLRNRQIRADTLKKITIDTAKDIKEVMALDLDTKLKEETIQQMYALRKRVVANIMKELGEDDSEE